MQKIRQKKSGLKGKSAQPRKSVKSQQDSRAPGPIDELPNVVMVLIFLAATENKKANGSPVYPLPEVTISHVSSKWRTLALSTPSLWTFFRFDGTRATRTPHDRLEAYLERSQNRPLDFWVNVTYSDGELPWDEQVEVVQSLQPYFNRCRRFYFITDESEIFHNFICTLEDIEASMLEVLAAAQSTNLDDFDTPRTLSEFSTGVFLAGAPSLKFFSLSGTSIFHYRPPLDAVVHLRLETSSTLSVRFDAIALDSILSLPYLKALSIRGPVFKVANPPDYRAVEARTLEHFRCDHDKDDGDSTTIGEYFLSHVEGPSLKSITLEGIDVGMRLQQPAERYPSLQTLILRQGYRYSAPPSSDVSFIVDILSTAPAVHQLVWVGDDTALIPFARALAKAGIPTGVREVIVDGKLDESSGILCPLSTAFPKLSTVRVREDYVELLEAEKSAGRPIQTKSLGPSKSLSRHDCWGESDGWPCRVDARYADWRSFDFQWN